MTSNVEFHLKDEMIAYCQSNVRLFKVGCQKFMAEFRLKAGFDPNEKSITGVSFIPSARLSLSNPPEDGMVLKSTSLK